MAVAIAVVAGLVLVGFVASIRILKQYERACSSGLADCSTARAGLG